MFKQRMSNLIIRIRQIISIHLFIKNIVYDFTVRLVLLNEKFK
jgi:hypothetical protein